MTRGPKGLDVGTDDAETTDGIPDTISNRAAIISARIYNGGAGSWATLKNVTAVLVAAAELDDEVRNLAELRDAPDAQDRGDDECEEPLK